MKKEYIKYIFALIILGIVVFTICFIFNIHFKADVLYGKSHCMGHDILLAGSAITPYNCRICGKRYENSNINTPKICDSCAEKLGRCQECGKLKN